MTEVLQVPQLPVDLLLHIERLLALSLAPLVPGDHELADLIADAASLGYEVLAVSGGEPFLYPHLPEFLGHAKAAITLDVYSHLLPGSDAAAAKAIEGVLK